MQPKLLVLSALLIISYFTKAQTTAVHVTIKATGSDSVAGATIQLYTLPDSVLRQEAISRTQNILQVKPGAYLVKVIATGFDTAVKNISVAGKPVWVEFVLKAAYKNLNNVTVTATKPLMRQEDDKTLVDAEQLATASTNAYEVLEKVPGAVLDQDGNIYLNSSTPAVVYINGVQMRMSADDITALLKSLPAGSVSRIEVIRTPSARYDASNSGGIINIVLKKGVQVGASGSVNLRTDQGVYNNTTAGFTLNRAAGKTRSYLSYQYTTRSYFDDIQSTRIIHLDTAIMQKSYTRYAPVTNYIGAGIGANFNSRVDVSYDVRITHNHNSNDAQTFNAIAKAQNAFYTTQSPIASRGNNLVINNTLFAKYKLDSAGSEWDNEVNYIYSKNTNAQDYTQQQLQPQQMLVYGDGDNNSHANLVSVKSDVILKLPHTLMLETGLKFGSSVNDNAALYYQQKGTMPKYTDSFKTNTFHYRENIGSGYVQLSKVFFGYTFKAGVRLEYTDIYGHQTVPQGVPFYIRRTDLFPYFYIRKHILTVFGYPLMSNVVLRRSITRPGYEQLNPSPQFVDQFTYNSGNPRLQPQFTNNVEVNATYNDFPVFAVGINNTRDVFSMVTYQNDTSKIAFRTYDNLGSYKEVYWRLFGGLPAGHRYFMYAGVQFNNVHYKGTYDGAPLDYSRASWTFFSGHQFKATPTLSFNLNGWMLVNGFRLFNELKNMGQLNLSLTKTMMRKKLAVIISGNDLLRTNKSAFSINQQGIVLNGTRLQDTRRVGITLRYNFGINRSEEKKQNLAPPPGEGAEQTQQAN